MTEECKWCDTLTNTLVKVFDIEVFDEGRLVWVGCPDCYEKKKEIKSK